MKRLFYLSILTTLSLTFLTTTVFADYGDTKIVDLIAGQNFDTPVGYVAVWVEKDETDTPKLKVQYTIDIEPPSYWFLTAIHLYVAGTLCHMFLPKANPSAYQGHIKAECKA